MNLIKANFTNRKLWVVIFLDIVIFGGSYYLSYWLRFDVIPPYYLNLFVQSVALVIACKLIIFYFSGLYRGLWRYTGISDMVKIVVAASLATPVVVALITYYHRFTGYPRSIFVLDLILTIILAIGIRVAIRLSYFPHTLGFLYHWGLFRADRGRRLLIIGAGNDGEKVLREIMASPGINYFPVCFLDNDPIKRGQRIHGVPIRGGMDILPQITVEQAIDEALIALPSASREEMRAIISTLNTLNVPYRIIPAMREYIRGQVLTREVVFEDFLGREPIALDDGGISEYLYGKRILITGAGGSIGSELCRQVCRYRPAVVVLFEQTEFSLFKIDNELKEICPDVSVVPVIGDILDPESLSAAFRTYQPEVVFHAAAYKHVSMMEKNPIEAIKNNVFGTIHVATLALQHQVRRFILVSTDKAVRPTSIMGATKRAGEIFAQCLNAQGTTKFITVRFGNVVGSDGSVVPIFMEQIKRGGPVTVTHPEVCRYFMSIPEAVSLILQASSMGHGGEIFVLDMGKPIRIVDLACDLIRLAGKRPYEDIKIDFIGLRPGEKLHEELFITGEDIHPTSHDKIRVAKSLTHDFKQLQKQLTQLQELVEQPDVKSALQVLHAMDPTYQPSEEFHLPDPPLPQPAKHRADLHLVSGQVSTV
ncbi:MAG: polysaccharide biosynthesis protein [Deltaproteobacteria bacterium]|nr:polysaccharide biosynthesis protein [Deltaproteobacteria bacterium]